MVLFNTKKSNLINQTLKPYNGFSKLRSNRSTIGVSVSCYPGLAPANLLRVCTLFFFYKCILFYLSVCSIIRYNIITYCYLPYHKLDDSFLYD